MPRAPSYLSLLLTGNDPLYARVQHLVAEPYTLHRATTLTEAIALVRQHRVALILLDVESQHGLQMCEPLHHVSRAPILGLAPSAARCKKALANHHLLDCIHLTEADLAEHIERWAIEDTQQHSATPPSVVVYGDITVDLATRQVMRSGEIIRLSRTEWRLLAALVQQAPAPVETLALVEQVWGRADGATPDHVRTWIGRLRKRIELNPRKPEYIINTRSSYQFAYVPSTAEETFSTVSNLPRPMTAFIGRTTDLNLLNRLLTDAPTRLLTLLGPAGVGKTRLAIAVSTMVEPSFADGVCFVELADITDPALVLSRIADRLGISVEDDHTLLQHVIAFLKTRTVLLVIDNVEHLLDSTATLIAQLLREVHTVTVLTTSREPLDLYGEQHYEVQPLSLPQPLAPVVTDDVAVPTTDSEAMHLLIARVQLIQPTFALRPQNYAALAQICVDLAGIPLALELAAAQIAQRGAHEVQAEIAQWQLDVLVSTARDRDARQRTLRGAIAWSYNLLDAAHQHLFRCLGVFTTSFTAEAVAHICTIPGQTQDDVAVQLVNLARKQMLYQQAHEGDISYWNMLESIRAYAVEQLTQYGETNTIAERRASYYTNLLDQADEQLFGAHRSQWIARLAREYATIRSTLVWAREQPDAQSLLHITGAMWRFWDACGYISEGRWWLEAALNEWQIAHNQHRQDSSTTQRLWARTLNGAGALAFMAADYAVAETRYSQAHTIYQHLDDTLGIARTLMNIGMIAQHQGDLTTAQTFLTNSLVAYRRLRDPSRMPGILCNLSEVEIAAGNYTQAEVHLTEVLSLSDTFHYPLFRALALEKLGDIAQLRQQYVIAQHLYREGLNQYQETGSALDQTRLHIRLALLEDDLHVAAASLCENIDQAIQQDAPRSIVEALETLSIVLSRAATVPAWLLAATLHAAATAYCRDKHMALDACLVPRVHQAVELLNQRLDPATFEQYSAAGARLSLTQAAAQARQSLADIA